MISNYKYSPFNVFSIIIGMLSILFILSMISNTTDLLNTLLSEFIFYPILSITIWVIDYYFQQKQVNFRILFLVELLVVLIIILYNMNALAKVY
jgi:hypothetical protein